MFARGRHTGDFVPGWVSKSELPDGGAVHLLESAEYADERHAGGFGDQIIGIHMAWPETHEHAKWAITKDNNWVCVGDTRTLCRTRRSSRAE